MSQVASWTPEVADALAAITAECRSADGQDPLDEAAWLRLKNHGLAGSSLWLTESGFALLHEGSLDLAVAPVGRRSGTGSALAAAAVSAGAESAWSHGDHPAARALATRHGFERTRELWVMRRPVATPLADVPAAPEDPERSFTIRPFQTGDEESLLRANAAAFASHPEQGAMDAANLAERMAEPWFSAEGLLVAEASSGELLGFHWTKVHSDQTGEVYVVAIDPSAQGRGLGKALTLAGLHHLASVVSEEVILYVESDNLPARAVYEGLGFTHAASDTHVQYTRN